jgi:hypothetical protein
MPNNAPIQPPKRKILGQDDVLPERQPDPNKAEPPGGYYPYIPPMRPVMDDTTKQKITDDWVQNVRNTLGDYSGQQQDAYGAPYYVYTKDGVKRGIRQGPDNFSYQIALPGQPWETRDFPGAQSNREVYNAVNSVKRNPWTPDQGWGKDASVMSMGEMADAKNQIEAFNSTHPVSTETLNGQVAMIKDMNTVRNLLGKLSTVDLNTIGQAGTNLVNMSGLDAKHLGVPEETFNNFIRLRDTLEHLSHEGIDLAGLPGKGNNETASAIPSSAGNMLEQFALINKGSAGALMGSEALKGIGQFAKAIGDKTFDINALRESIGPQLNESRQLLYNETASLVNSGGRVPQPIRNAANQAAYDAEDEGIGLNGNPYDLSKTADIADKQNDINDTFTQGTPGLKPQPQTPAAKAAVTQGVKNLQNPPLAPIASPTPKATPATPAPSPTPLGDNTQAATQPQVAQNQSSVQVPRLTEQNDVDQLEPGTPFYWADHDSPYVKT